MNLPLYYLLSKITSCLSAETSGRRKSELVLNCRLRSLPARPVLKFPTTTPSGLSMGIILNTTCFRI